MTVHSGSGQYTKEYTRFAGGRKLVLRVYSGRLWLTIYYELRCHTDGLEDPIAQELVKINTNARTDLPETICSSRQHTSWNLRVPVAFFHHFHVMDE